MQRVSRWECLVADDAGCSLVEVCRPPLSLLSADSTHSVWLTIVRKVCHRLGVSSLPRPTTRASPLLHPRSRYPVSANRGTGRMTGAIFWKKRRQRHGPLSRGERSKVWLGYIGGCRYVSSNLAFLQVSAMDSVRSLISGLEGAVGV